MRGRQLWWIVPPVVAIDRIAKRIALETLSGGAVNAIPGVLSWHLTRNTGAAFSMLIGKSALLTVLTFILIAAITVYLLRAADIRPMTCVGLWCIVGGGLGNLWDRLFSGGVIDFIRLDFIPFPIFNFADVFVCAGAVLVVLSALPGKENPHV